jgi:uncharacterized protein
MSQPAQTSLFARRPLLMYFVLSYAFFWLVIILFGAVVVGALGVKPEGAPLWAVRIVGSWMPSLAAAIVTAAVEGRGGVARLFAKMVQFRVAARWYLAALIPVAIVVAALLVYRLTGGEPEGGVSLTSAFLVSFLLLNFVVGPTGEEPGWRGFALPRLVQRFGPLLASLILGVLWAFWHMPLWLTSGLAPMTLLLYVLAFCVGNISLTYLMTWIYLRVPHSLVPMTVAHYTFNIALTFIGPEGLGLGAAMPFMGWTAGLFVLTVIVLWAGWPARKA